MGPIGVLGRDSVQKAAALEQTSLLARHYDTIDRRPADRDRDAELNRRASVHRNAGHEDLVVARGDPCDLAIGDPKALARRSDTKWRVHRLPVGPDRLDLDGCRLAGRNLHTLRLCSDSGDGLS